MVTRINPYRERYCSRCCTSHSVIDRFSENPARPSATFGERPGLRYDQRFQQTFCFWQAVRLFANRLPGLRQNVVSLLTVGLAQYLANAGTHTVDLILG